MREMGAVERKGAGGRKAERWGGILLLSMASGNSDSDCVEWGKEGEWRLRDDGGGERKKKGAKKGGGMACKKKIKCVESGFGEILSSASIGEKVERIFMQNLIRCFSIFR